MSSGFASFIWGDMAEIFWRISQEARVKLIQYQAEIHKDKPALDMAKQKAPWELETPRPEIPVHTDMSEEELDKFMRRKPRHPARVK